VTSSNGPVTRQALPADLAALRRFAVLMDEAFRFPGTQRRFGVDAVLGLIPGLGDFVGALMSLWVLGAAFRYRVPFSTHFRIVGNIVVDMVVGLVPVVGDLFDVVFKENVQNVDLIISTRDFTRPPRGIGVFFAIIAALGAMLAALVMAGLALLYAAFMDLHRMIYGA
jgi:hypothetical protein